MRSVDRLAAGLAVISAMLLGSPAARAVERVAWHSGPGLVALLLREHQQGGGEGIELHDYEPGVAVVASDCVLEVPRPERGEGPQQDRELRLSCWLHQRGRHETGGLTWPWPTAEVRYWGNRFDRNKPFEIRGAAMAHLLHALRHAYERHQTRPRLDRTDLCGPDGQTCLEIFSMSRGPDVDAPSALLCSTQRGDGRDAPVDCVFHPAAVGL